MAPSSNNMPVLSINNQRTDITQLLIEASGGNRVALDQLFPMVYDVLKRIARKQRRNERDDLTMSTTDLVHEAYLKLIDHREIDWKNRAHFFAISARAMRRILVDYARTKTRQKRGGDQIRITLEEANMVLTAERAEDLLALDEALTRLEKISERASKVVEARYFAGLNIDETAEALGVSEMTVKRDWTMAKGWLKLALEEDQ